MNPDAPSPLPPLRFIGEPIEVHFDQPPLLTKAPPCPAEFVWQATVYRVTALLAEWHDYRRRGRQARNMRPEHLARAARRGSWGSGRFYFRVRAVSAAGPGQIFELYFDRTPQDADRRQGGWFLVSELADDEPNSPARAS